MAANPSVGIGFLDGNVSSTLTLSDDVAIKLGAATSGSYLVPTRQSSMNGVVSQYLHGPLVRSGAHHMDYSGPAYLMRIRASTVGTIGAVAKTPSAAYLASLGSMSLALTTYTPHSAIVGGSGATAWNLAAASGWQKPLAPLALTITAAAMVVSHTETITGLDSGGVATTEVVTVSSAATFTSTTEWSQILKIVANVDPGVSISYSFAWLTPGDRYNALVTCTTGGVLGVTGGTTPVYTLSLDGGITNSRNLSMPSNGTIEMLTYAGGLVAQSTGQTATFTAGSLGSTIWGSVKAPGVDENGDIMFSGLQALFSVTVVVAGMNTALSITVSGVDITINAATDGAAAITSTGTSIVTYFNTNGGAGATAARLVATATAIGTGASKSAALAKTLAPNGGVVLTPLVEGVRVRFVNGGATQTHKIVTIGKDVTFYADTDSFGEQTTTSTNAVTYLNANADASLLISAAAQGSGAGVVGTTGLYTALAVSVATGDAFTWTTTPPVWNDADLAAALAALLANPTWLSYFSVLHVIGASEDTADTTISTWVDNVAKVRKQFKCAVMETQHMADVGTGVGTAAENTWLGNLTATYLGRSTNYGLAAGEANCLNTAYGTVDRMNVATPYLARLMICPISELPSHVDCETFYGIQNAVNGVLSRPNAGDQPLWQTDDTLVTCNSNNYVTLRTHAGRAGIYVRQGLEFTTDGSDYTFVTNKRCAMTAATLAYDETLRFLNANLLADTKTGQLSEAECQKLESQISGRLRKKLVGNDRGRQHLSGLNFVIDRGAVYVGVGQVTGTLYLVPRQPAVSFTVNIGYFATLQTR